MSVPPTTVDLLQFLPEVFQTLRLGRDATLCSGQDCTDVCLELTKAVGWACGDIWSEQGGDRGFNTARCHPEALPEAYEPKSHTFTGFVHVATQAYWNSYIFGKDEYRNVHCSIIYTPEKLTIKWRNCDSSQPPGTPALVQPSPTLNSTLLHKQ